MTWDNEFKIEATHRPCLCGICHKQIGTKTPRVTLVVTNESGWRTSDYKKFFHLKCLVVELKKGCKTIAEKEINKRMKQLTRIQKAIEELGI